MKDLRPTRGSRFLQQAIAEGEHERQDFKFAISDARKIARSISAFANHLGGRLLIGVKDNGVIAGVRNDEDLYVVEQAALMYCRPAQSPHFELLRTSDGLNVIVASFDAAPQKGVQAQEPDGRWRAYRRVADENILASPLMVKAWRHAADNPAMMFRLDDTHRRVLDLLGRHQGMTLDELMTHTRMSRLAAEQAIITLYAMGIVDFTFHSRQFLITLR